MKTKIFTLVLAVLFLMPCVLRAEEVEIQLMEAISMQPISGDAPLDDPIQSPGVPTRPNDFRALINGNQLSILKYVYNIGGQLIKSINNFHINSELDVSMLPVGKYIVVLKDGEDEYVQHFLKSR